ncbi:unnamed protein product, partial [Effrenium voratum]
AQKKNKELVTVLTAIDQVTIHTDQENSLNHLYEKVTDKLGNDKVQLRKSPRYSSASLGSGEMVNGLIAGKIRFHVNKTKTTAHRILKGHDYLGELLPMGETVMAKYPNVKDRAKSDSRWVKGIYAGKTTQLDEHIALTEAGADTFRTVRRLPLGSQHQLVVLEQARGAPWNTVEGIEKAKPEGIRSKVDVRQLQEPILETEVTRGSGSAGDIAPREREIPPVFVPAPKISGRSIDPDGLTCQDFKKKQSPEEKEIQEYLKDVPREELIWQVDGNIYGRQSAAAQYRDRPEEMLTNKELVKEKQVAIAKVDGKQNPADALTKHLVTGRKGVRSIQKCQLCG